MLLNRRTAIGGALAATLPACARRRDPDTLNFWAMSVEGENAKYLLPAFTRATGINVELQPLPWTAAHEKVMTGYAGGSLPDVAMISGQWMGEMVTLGAVRPVPPALRGALDDIYPNLVDQVTMGGRSYGVPWYVGSSVQYYRRDLLRAAGYRAPQYDWAGWKAMLAAIKRRRPDQFALFAPLNDPNLLVTFALQQGEPLLRANDTFGNFRSPAFRTALGYYKSLFDDALAPKVLTTDIADPLTEFARGWFAVMVSGPWTVGELLRRPDNAQIPWTTALLPGPHGPGGSTVGGGSLVVTQNARDPAQAWQLVRYLSQPATQLEFLRITGDLPSRRSAWTAPALADVPVNQTFARQILLGIAVPKVFEWERIMQELQLVAEQVVRGYYSVDAGAAEIDRRTDAILAKRRALLDKGAIA